MLHDSPVGFFCLEPPVDCLPLLVDTILSPHLSLAQGVPMPRKRKSTSTSIFSDDFGAPLATPPPASRVTKPSANPNKVQLETAIVYCQGHFGGIGGKTANGLVRHSEKYEILSIIDSENSGQDAGKVLDGEPSGIPVYEDFDEALMYTSEVPDYFIFGISPASGKLSSHERQLILRAIDHGMNIVNGLHEFLNDDPQFVAACAKSKVVIRDVQQPRDKKDLRVFSGRIADVTCPRIAILGTDCAIGKRTTATILTRALNERGIKAVMIGTGQTGLIQGARYGMVLDAIPAQFCAGELEAKIIEAFENEEPDVIVIEGQGSLSHPASSTSSFILRGSCPQGVVLQHAPRREHRCDFDDIPMPDPGSEIHLIETFALTKVIGLTLNHENMTDAQVSSSIKSYEKKFGVPVTDALTRPPERLVEMVLSAFPEIEASLLV